MKHATDEDLAKSKAQAGLQHATDEDLEQAKHKAGLDRQNTSLFRDDDSISTKATDVGVAEAKESAPEPEKKKRRSWFGSRGSRPSTSESRPGTGDKPKRRSFLSRFSRGSRASTPGEGEERPRSRDDDDTHTYTETIDDTVLEWLSSSNLEASRVVGQRRLLDLGSQSDVFRDTFEESGCAVAGRQDRAVPRVEQRNNL